MLLGTFASLRWSELAGLRRTHLDLDQGVIRVAGALVEIGGGKVLDDSPKSRAGRRAVSIPSEIIPELRAHLDMFAEPGENGRVFTGPNGGPLKHSGSAGHGTRSVWLSSLPDLHFHDLRHIGNTLAASNGASLKELMSRMGHSSTRAALIYQHASQDRDKAIARALGQAFKKARAGGHEKPSGTQRARKIIKFQ